VSVDIVEALRVTGDDIEHDLWLAYDLPHKHHLGGPEGLGEAELRKFCLFVAAESSTSVSLVWNRGTFVARVHGPEGSIVSLEARHTHLSVAERRVLGDAFNTARKRGIYQGKARFSFPRSFF
jgi:hypothetical protein